VSSAEMVYGVPLTFPRTHFTRDSGQDPVYYYRFHAPFHTASISGGCFFLSAGSAQKVTHVYVLRVGVIHPLAPRYQGSFLVLNRKRKCFAWPWATGWRQSPSIG
jgi:hypothetical protein